MAKAVRQTKKPTKRKAALASRGRRQRETHADRLARARRLLERLRAAYPAATCALHHDSAYTLLVATILSAQCTDE
ncbi:MAG: endonuclease III, partial [Planctomycetota bacterium]